MERGLRLLDHVYRKNDTSRVEGKIISVEESDMNELKYIVFFPGEENYFFYYASELVLCNNKVDTIFSSNVFKQHPFQPKEISDSEIYAILDTEIDNPSARRILWYNILFYKLSILSNGPSKTKQERGYIHPILLRLLQYPIPDEIRCFVWSEFLGVRSSYEIGYYSLIRNKQSVIPSSSLSVIEADLRRMEVTPQEYAQLLRLLTSIYLHDPKTGYVQGMHFLAYVLLQIFAEEEAFFVFLRILHFLPENYYGKNLEGVNTDLLVVAALLNKLDPFLYSSVEAKVESMIFFLSPVYKWLVDLYTHPFQTAFSYQLLDLLFCFGNWSLVLAPIAMVIDSRQNFITCATIEQSTTLFSYIPASYHANHSILQHFYELCLVTDAKEIDELRNHLRNENSFTSYSDASEDLVVDEQNGLVGDLYSVQSREMNRSLQLSVHMHTISSNLLRVSGVQDTTMDSETAISSRISFGVENKNHLLDFDELSEHYEEESDFNPWRESVLEEDVLSEGKVFSPLRSLRNSIDLPCVEETDSKSCKSYESGESCDIQPKTRHMSKRWLSADAISKKVVAMVDAIRNKTTYNVTNGIQEAVSDGHFLFSQTISVDEQYLSNYPVMHFPMNFFVC